MINNAGVTYVYLRSNKTTGGSCCCVIKTPRALALGVSNVKEMFGN